MGQAKKEQGSVVPQAMAAQTDEVRTNADHVGQEAMVLQAGKVHVGMDHAGQVQVGNDPQKRTIYLDNAATTKHKPEAVVRAVTHALSSFGNVGRGAYGSALEASLTVFDARCAVADLIGLSHPARVAFTSNATEALNSAVSGIVRYAGGAQNVVFVTTAASHNSVLRPLYRLEHEGASLSIVPHERDGSLDYHTFEAKVNQAADQLCGSQILCAVVTHASNLTGEIYDIARMAQAVKQRGGLIVIDAAQTAGVVPLNMKLNKLDVVCITGHKALYGPQGTGALCIREGLDLPSFKVGGSGSHSFDKRHPAEMPDAFEAGTLNAHGIAGLLAGIQFVQRTEQQLQQERLSLIAKERQLRQRFIEGVASCSSIEIYGQRRSENTLGIVACNVAGVDSALICDALFTQYGIEARSGIHCAPLMHEALGSDKNGAVRLSVSAFTTIEDIDVAAAAMREIAYVYHRD